MLLKAGCSCFMIGLYECVCRLDDASSAVTHDNSWLIIFDCSAQSRKTLCRAAEAYRSFSTVSESPHAFPVESHHPQRKYQILDMQDMRVTSLFFLTVLPHRLAVKGYWTYSVCCIVTWNTIIWLVGGLILLVCKLVSAKGLSDFGAWTLLCIFASLCNNQSKSTAEWALL